MPSGCWTPSWLPPTPPQSTILPAIRLPSSGRESLPTKPTVSPRPSVRPSAPSSKAGSTAPDRPSSRAATSAQARTVVCREELRHRRRIAPRAQRRPHPFGHGKRPQRQGLVAVLAEREGLGGLDQPTHENQSLGCPECARARWSIPEPGQSLAELHPAIAAEWHPTKNHPQGPGTLSPERSSACGGCARFAGRTGRWAIDGRSRAISSRRSPGPAGHPTDRQCLRLLASSVTALPSGNFQTRRFDPCLQLCMAASLLSTTKVGLPVLGKAGRRIPADMAAQSA
jgi:hypothetical protein